MTEVQGSSLARKLAEVMGEIDWIPKLGTNAAQGYKFVREADVVDAVRGKLSVRKVAVFPTVKSLHMEPITAKSGLAGMFVMVEMAYTLVDGDSGESMTIEAAGSGTDYPGDKAVYKAQTGAKKYALFQAFQIATGDDPEDEQSEPRKGQSQRNQPAQDKRSEPKQAKTPTPAPIRSQAHSGPITDAELKRLMTLATDLKWDDDTRHAYAGVASFKDLTSYKAQELAGLWVRFLNARNKAIARKEPIPDFPKPGDSKPTAEGSTPNPTTQAVQAALKCSNIGEQGQPCIAKMPHEMGKECAFVTEFENNGKGQTKKKEAVS